ncbi:MAG: RNA polymerase sigma factor [Ilumatobacteraceae bacterium]
MKRGTRYGYSLRGLKAGDGNAWSWLVAEFSGKLVGYATRMGARDPEEVMSATLETIANRIADFEGNEAQMRSFIFSIAHARIVDDLRKATRRSEVSIENTLTVLEADEPNEDTFTDPDLLEALERLPDDQRRMLELRYVVGLSTKETADAIGKSEVATRVGLSRAFARLKDLLVDDLRASSQEEALS